MRERRADDREPSAAEQAENARRFERAIVQILDVSKEELTRREGAYQQSRMHKDRPGPKRSQ